MLHFIVVKNKQKFSFKYAYIIREKLLYKTI